MVFGLYLLIFNFEMRSPKCLKIDMPLYQPSNDFLAYVSLLSLSVTNVWVQIIAYFSLMKNVAQFERQDKQKHLFTL